MQVQFDSTVATIVMDEGKGNALDGRTVGRLREALGEVRATGAAAAILTGRGHIFSAGLNLPALSALERPVLEQFMTDFTTLCIEMLDLPLPLIAAINGHAIAGGCILALCCDYRVMARGDCRIGLNEVDLGLRFPTAILEIPRAVLPPITWPELLLAGRQLDPEEAAGVGMVHTLAEPELLTQRALAFARELASKPGDAVGLLKKDLNAPPEPVEVA
jgi:enoyl-CoA hydratase